MAMSAIMLSVSDDLINGVAEIKDQGDVQRVLEQNFQFRDPEQVLMLTSQLHVLYMYEGGLVENYIKKVHKIKKQAGCNGRNILTKL